MSELVSPQILPSPILPSPIPLLLPRDSDVRLDRAQQRGRLVRLFRGVYAEAAAYRGLRPWERYLARVHAFALLHPEAVLCLESAAALQGAPVFGHPDEVHVLTANGTSRATAGVRAHRSTRPRELLRAAGVTAVGPADTALDVARLRHPVIGTAMLDALLRRTDAPDGAELLRRNARWRGARGRAKAEEAIRFADGLAETPLESASRCVVAWSGFDVPELQVVVPTRGGEFRVDMRWRAERITGEADGALKYDGSRGAPAEAILTEKRRERFLRECGEVVRWGWSEVRAPAELIAALRTVGLPQRRAPRDALLMTLPAALGARP
ncbi:hypothetical protein [Microbacterium sp. JZ37]|uniref:hypothetical protein n=1 Tax=Microbacterium sp. JZ37 TaxID=2654193 RepID=UPI002B4A0D05|nr:hypothetical protein [Microbacterium sp. JZ37]WRH17557.1 hypothetical protein GC092_08585 [Microbacterium sp. JZ37]